MWQAKRNLIYNIVRGNKVVANGMYPDIFFISKDKETASGDK